jgi:nucleotide-binding universal stress UspA family protein
MENLSKSIVIPTDFTVVAEYAIESAIPYAKVSNNGIVLLHIVKKSSEIPSATVKVELEAANMAKKYGVRFNGIVREGSIFSTIGEIVSELEASLVLMGTHGIKGMQKLTGSWALKVIITSKVPIIVVQQPPKKSSVDRIVFPIDYKRENREKISWAYYVAKMFDSKVYVFRTEHSKDKKLEHGVRANMIFTEKFMRSKSIQYETATAKGHSSFAQETLQYAESVNADMILITTTKGISTLDFVLGTVEEDLIANSANIPIMCVNPRKGKIGGFSATGG